ncbi:MAG: hypothetical protein VB858_10620, partial [Planctomycetaceae bacterium]
MTAAISTPVETVPENVSDSPTCFHAQIFEPHPEGSDTCSLPLIVPPRWISGKGTLAGNPSRWHYEG